MHRDSKRRQTQACWKVAAFYKQPLSYSCGPSYAVGLVYSYTGEKCQTANGGHGPRGPGWIRHCKRTLKLTVDILKRFVPLAFSAPPPCSPLSNPVLEPPLSYGPNGVFNYCEVSVVRTVTLSSAGWAFHTGWSKCCLYVCVSACVCLCVCVCMTCGC